MEKVVAIALVGWFAFCAFVVIASVGKPRKPITHSVAVVNTAVMILVMFGVTYLFKA